MGTYVTSRTNLDPEVLPWAGSIINGDGHCYLPSLLSLSMQDREGTRSNP